MIRCIFAACVLLSSTYVRCANILCVFSLASISNQNALQPLARELSLRGHNVTLYTPRPLKDPSLDNLTEVDVSELFVHFRGNQDKEALYHDYSPYKRFTQLFEKILLPMEQAFMEHPKVQQLVSDNISRYDVVLTQVGHFSLLQLGNKFNCPTIVISSTDQFMAVHALIGNSVHPVLYPEVLLSYVGELNFFERLSNSLQSLKIWLYCQFTLFPLQSQSVKRYFGEHSPDVVDLIRNVSVFFSNVNPTFNAGRPLVPNTVEFSYLHIKPKKDLPQDLKVFLDGAPEGVVYMSLGSNVQSIHLPVRIMKVLVDTFSDIPYKVVWKWENESLTGVSSNVLLRKWLPQQDILGHQNVRVFMTQAGIQSTEEAILNGAPTVALPFFCDQTLNAKRMEYLGMGKYLNPFTVTKGQLKAAIVEVMENPKYRTKVQEMSRVSLDQRWTGLEKVVWSTEYVIRNKGAKYLKSPHMKLPLYQCYMLDVFGFVGLSIYITYLALRSISNYYRTILVGFLTLVISYSVYD